jgi:hypothetical protein
MYQVKFLRSNNVGSAATSAAILFLMLSGCVDRQPTSPERPLVARGLNVASGDFLVAWSRGFASDPIQTQNFTLDSRQNRQYGGWWPEENVLAFAVANPGRLYINGDEPDQWCIDPHEYAGMYKLFVDKVRAADPTAKFSPAGFAEPNDKCCTEGDEECRQRMHSTGYAQRFYDAYLQRYGGPPPVDEWRFHDFGLAYADGDMNGWWSRVDRLASWSKAHGAPMVLGAWGFHGWKGPMPQHQEYMKQAIGRLMNDSRINEAVYWSYESWAGEAHYLVNGDGSLTPEGQTFANPLTDVPTGVSLVGASSATAKLRWSNTTAAWSTEVEFWGKTPGSDDFVYRKTQRITGPAATESAYDEFQIGELVKARVRYYNPYAQAEWSSFSEPVVMSLGDGVKRTGAKKSPRLCFLPTKLQLQRCD